MVGVVIEKVHVMQRAFRSAKVAFFVSYGRLSLRESSVLGFVRDAKSDTYFPHDSKLAWLNWRAAIRFDESRDSLQCML
jgi:hypothetical protein